VARLNRCLSFKRGVRAELADALVQEIHRDGINHIGFAQYFNGVTQLVADESHELAVSVLDVHLHHQDTVRCGLRHSRDTGLHSVSAALTLFDIDDVVGGVDRFNQAAKRLRSLGCTLDERSDAR
jgi:hypothetical protein